MVRKRIPTEVETAAQPLAPADVGANAPPRLSEALADFTIAQASKEPHVSN